MTVLPIANLVTQLIEDARQGSEVVPLDTCLAIAAHFKPTARLWTDNFTQSWIELTFEDGTTTTFMIEDRP